MFKLFCRILDISETMDTSNLKQILNSINLLVGQQLNCTLHEIQGHLCLKAAEGESFVFYNSKDSSQTVITPSVEVRLCDSRNSAWFTFFRCSVSTDNPSINLGILGTNGVLNQLIHCPVPEPEEC
jgi:hypothetical protein